MILSLSLSLVGEAIFSLLVTFIRQTDHLVILHINPSTGMHTHLLTYVGKCLQDCSYTHFVQIVLNVIMIWKEYVVVLRAANVRVH